MKTRLLKLACLLSLLVAGAGAASAQIGNVTLLLFPGVPTGGCGSLQVAENASNGNLYTCVAGAWVLNAGGGTVTHGAGALTATKIAIGNGGADLTVDPNASTDGVGDVTAVSYTTSGSNGGFSATEGTCANVPAAPAAGVDILCFSSTGGPRGTHGLLKNENNGGWLNLAGVASAGTSGHLATFAANGIDLADGGAAPAAAKNAVVAFSFCTTGATAMTFTSGSNFYFGVGLCTSGTAPQATETTVQMIAPYTGTAQHLMVHMGTAPTAGTSVVFTFRDAAAGTALTCTWSAGQTCTDTTHTVTVTQGDLIDVQILCTTGTGTCATLFLNVNASLQIL